MSAVKEVAESRIGKGNHGVKDAGWAVKGVGSKDTVLQKMAAKFEKHEQKNEEAINAFISKFGKPTGGKPAKTGASRPGVEASQKLLIEGFKQFEREGKEAAGTSPARKGHIPQRPKLRDDRPHRKPQMVQMEAEEEAEPVQAALSAISEIRELLSHS